MRQPTRSRAMSTYWAALIGFAALLPTCVPASAQNAEVYLIRRDSSDCTNSDVSPNDPNIGGTVWLTQKNDGNTSIKVAVTLDPNQTYHFFLKCVRLLGDIKTQDEGEAIVTFEFPTKDAGSTYAFDMYPEGAPSGKKYQSVQVKLK